jgi:hypothetical protein
VGVLYLHHTLHPILREDISKSKGPQKSQKINPTVRNVLKILFNFLGGKKALLNIKKHTLMHEYMYLPVAWMIHNCSQ